MGTSTSFRAPAAPRWQAFVAALQADVPLERVRSELFNAGDEWEVELSGPGVAAFAAAVANAYEELAPSLETAPRPEAAIQAYIAEARAESRAAGGTPAIALAERALAALLTRSAAQGASLSERTSLEAARALRGTLGEPQTAVTAFLTELIGQYARHIVAREAGRLTESEPALGATALQGRVRELSAQAEEAALSVRRSPDIESLAESWPTLVHEAFEAGRTLHSGNP